VSAFSESCVGQAGLAWLESLGRQFKHGPDISAAGNTLTLALCQRERKSCSELLPAPRLRDALARLNPTLPAGALEDAFRNLTRSDLPASPCSAPAGGADLLQRNRAGHRLWVDSVTVEYRTVGGGIRSAPVARHGIRGSIAMAARIFPRYASPHLSFPELGKSASDWVPRRSSPGIFEVHLRTTEK